VVKQKREGGDATLPSTVSEFDPYLLEDETDSRVYGRLAKSDAYRGVQTADWLRQADRASALHGIMLLSRTVPPLEVIIFQPEADSSC
jgi:hypothetical protein